MTILVIEDDLRLRHMIRTIMQHDGWDVIEAVEGRQGVLLARAHAPDIILCDFAMEGMNGYQTLATLRASDATATIPFILMTGVTERAAHRSSMDLGADDYLTKPFDASSLLKAVQARMQRVREGREQAERRLAALRASIVGALPHELITPLNGILGYSEMLRGEFDAFSREEIRAMIADIHGCAVTLDRLVRRFIEYMELTLRAANRDQLPAGDGACGKDAEAVVDRSARQTSSRHHRDADLKLSLEPAVPAITVAHLVRLTEELVDNACKFSAAHTGIEVATFARGDRFVLEVRDEGRGMTPEQIRDAGPLMQFNRRHHEQPGAGLGLAIARLLTELNGGELTLKSEPGRGTTVSVSLPLVP